MKDTAENYEKVRTFRNRKTKERITEETLKEKDKAHPVHVPYVRPHTNWKHNLLLDDE